MTDIEKNSKVQESYRHIKVEFYLLSDWFDVIN